MLMLTSAMDFLAAIIKIFILLIFVLFLPWLFLWHMQVQQYKVNTTSELNKFKLGVEVISEEFLKSLTPQNDLSYSVGLITNQTGTDQLGIRTVDLLLQKGLKINTIFSPQHGFDGKLQGNNKGEDSIDPKTKIPIINLHGKDGIKKLHKKNLEPLDVLIFDVQDVGLRYYGYSLTLLEIMYAAARLNKIVVVFDRPNILGAGIEGAFCSPCTDHTDSVGPIPLRHGLTIGELARYYNRYILTKPANLFVVPMQNYNRLSVPPTLIMNNISPNIGSIYSCYGYSFLGLLGEISPFDIGIGTDKAFQCITMPESCFSPRKWKELQNRLALLGVSSTPFRYFSKRKKCNYSGLRIFIQDINTFSAYKALFSTITFFKQEGMSFSFSSYFDRVIGTAYLRDFLEGRIVPEKICGELNMNAEKFIVKARDVFLYTPYPQPLRV